MKTAGLEGAEAAAVPLLEVNNLEVVYQSSIRAVEGLSLAVPKGSMVALMGSNGAGKTSSLRAITGILHSLEGRITKGQITYQGQVINGLDAADIVSAGIRLVPEGRRVFADLTVEENLRAGAHLVSDSAAIRRGMERVMTLFPNLAKYRKRLAGYLSGGEQQMVAIGRALISNPRLLILDEPSLGLAPVMVETIFDTLVRINREDGVTMLLVEQSAVLALQLASYGYILQHGRVVLEGDSQALGQHQDVQEFYLGGAQGGQRRSFREIKTYRRRKRWLS